MGEKIPMKNNKNSHIEKQQDNLYVGILIFIMISKSQLT